MASHNVIFHFTHDEMEAAGLTYAELSALSDENLIKLMQVKLDRFSPQTPEQAKLKEVLIRLAKNLAFALTCDALASTAKACALTLWKAVLSLTQQ